MDLFARNKHLADLEQQLAGLTGHARVPILVKLAWQLRQRNTKRALALVEEAQQLSGEAEKLTGLIDEKRTGMARLELIRSEAMLLNGEFDNAIELIATARQQCENSDDHIGLGDCLWLEASIALDYGNYAELDALLLQTIEIYAAHGETQRAQIATARRFCYAANINPDMTRDWLAKIAVSQEASCLHPALVTWVESARAALEPRGGNVNLHWQNAYKAALDSGQLRQAIITAIQMAGQFIALRDSASALEWADRGLEFARNAGWPGVTGICLLQNAEVFRSLGLNREARDLLEESLPILMPGSLANANAGLNLGTVALDLENYDEAVNRFEQADHCFQSIQSLEGQIRSRLGSSKALLQLGKFIKSRHVIEEVLAQAIKHATDDACVNVFRTLALFPHNYTAQESGSNEAEKQIKPGYMEEAIAKASDNFVVPADLLEEIVTQYINNGDINKGVIVGDEDTAVGQHKYNRHANRDAQNRDANLRAAALHMQKETERLRTSAEHHRQLSQIEAKRANDLFLDNAVLKRLGAIGQNMTTSLNTSVVFSVLDSHIHTLLDAYSMTIYQLSPDKSELLMAFGVENKSPIPAHKIQVNDELSNVAWCARRRQELALGLNDPVTKVLPGTMSPLSRMYAPLIVGERLLGVMSIQTPQADAYGEREKAIFRTLCAYGAIALANTETLSALNRAQDELLIKNRELEKLATEDSLTGLFNRRFLDLTLHQQFAATERYGNSLSVILLDIDHFKRVNDTFGHQVGDQVLILFGSLLQGRARDSDIVGRWGGEEFLILCPRSNLTDALLIAEKLRLLIEQNANPQVGVCTASFGVAQYRPGDNVSMLIARADHSLYVAKSQGRNQVVAGE